MSADETNEHPAIKPTDLRGILKYVPMFRGHVFVIAIDGSIVAHESFANVLLDIAVLRSLGIKIVLVHGIGSQLRALADQRGTAITDSYGEGRADEATLELASEAAAQVSLRVMQGLTRNGLRCVVSNAARGAEAGVVGGVDQERAGKVDKVDLALLHNLLDAETIPLVGPIVFDRDGRRLRVNSDHLASALSGRLRASKLIYLTAEPGLVLDGEPATNLTVGELEHWLTTRPEAVPERLRSKARHSVQALNGGLPRAHILDGREFGALLNEVFDKVGIGTMVYSNEYQSIRVATPADAHAIHTITRGAVRDQALRDRSLEAIRDEIDRFLVYEIDGSIVACARIETFEDPEVIEVGSVYVQPFYQDRGVGRKMIEYAGLEARHRGARKLIALTTQAAGFFRDVCGFADGAVDDLPAERRRAYADEGRNPRVLVKTLA